MRIVATTPIGQVAIEILERSAPVEVASTPDEATLLELLDGTVGLVCRGEGTASSRLIDAADDLRVIGRTGAGYDSVDVPAATRRGIAVVNAPVHAFAVAEGTVALLLALVKQLLLGDRIVREGRWPEKYAVVPGDLADHTLGIVGLGRIGRQVATLASAFGMTVLGYDPLIDPASVADLVSEVVDLETLLGRSDYVSLHLPLDESTRGLIDRRRLAQMKRGAILLNLARGPIVESLDVLLEALDSGQLGGVGLDVFPVEPPDSSHPIFEHQACVFSPHLVANTELALERIYRSMATDMVTVLNGGRPTFCVNPEVFE
jgi:D-3-phosphoglycerate dehydrogenase